MKRVEAFLGRNLTDNEKCGMFLNEDGSIKEIDIWDIKGVEKPSVEELNQIPKYPEDGREYSYDKESNQWIIDNSEEVKRKLRKAFLNLRKVRDIRDALINETIWIQQRHISEKQGLEAGVTTKQTTLTEEKYNEWLIYWQELRDLPSTINISIGDIDVQDIKADNLNIFPTPPNEKEEEKEEENEDY